MNTATCQSTCTPDPGDSRRPSLRDALGYLARSALELHRYRYLRTRMLHDSLESLDRHAPRK